MALSTGWTQQTQESIEKSETTGTPEPSAQPETPESKLEAIQEKVELGQDLTEDDQWSLHLYGLW